MSDRLKLIRWCATDDVESVDPAWPPAPCLVCGQPARLYSTGFVGAVHFRCAVRYWEMFDLDHAAARARAAVERLRALRPPAPETEDLNF